MSLIFKWKRFGLLIFINTNFICVFGQDYRAVQGSSFTGSLSVSNNPASIVHSPFKLDITPFAFQFKHSTNAIVIKNSNYISPAKNAEAFLQNGKYKSFLMANQDLRLLNASMRLRNNSAIAFGSSMRSYISANTSSILFQDTAATIRDFMRNNISNTPISSELRAHVWAEIFGSYARTIMENTNAIVNAGITLKVNRGLGAAFVDASNLGISPGTVNNTPGYYLTNGLLNYGYSANIDALDTSTNFKAAQKEFIKNTYSSLGLSLGAEYIVPDNGAGMGNGYDYSLKIGLSLLDLSTNKYKLSNYSRSAILNKNNVSDSLIDDFFINVTDPATLADSLGIIAASNNPLTGKFKIFQPTRIVINVDKHIAGNFFINGEVTIPLYSLLGKKQMVANDMNFINLAARMETEKFRIYLPVSINNKMHVWVGGAFRAGPLLFGLHNWASLLGKNKIQDSGGYIAFTFRFKGKNGSKRDPDQRNTDKMLQQLSCPPALQ